MFSSVFVWRSSRMFSFHRVGLHPVVLCEDFGFVWLLPRTRRRNSLPSDLVLFDEQVGVVAAAVSKVAESADGRHRSRSAVGQTGRRGDQPRLMTCHITIWRLTSRICLRFISLDVDQNRNNQKSRVKQLTVAPRSQTVQMDGRTRSERRHRRHFAKGHVALVIPFRKTAVKPKTKWQIQTKEEKNKTKRRPIRHH